MLKPEIHMEIRLVTGVCVMQKDYRQHVNIGHMRDVSNDVNVLWKILLSGEASINPKVRLDVQWTPPLGNKVFETIQKTGSMRVPAERGTNLVQ